jgi:hypothetical protein
LGGFIENKRGVTPVLSNVLLLIVAVSAMSLAASATYVITNNLRQTMGERILVEDVWFAPGSIAIYLRNVGKVQSTVKFVYINSVDQGINSITLEVGEHGRLNVTYEWTQSEIYAINIITGKGTKLIDYYAAP